MKYQSHLNYFKTFSFSFSENTFTLYETDQSNSAVRNIRTVVVFSENKKKKKKHKLCLGNANVLIKGSYNGLSPGKKPF